MEQSEIFFRKGGWETLEASYAYEYRVNRPIQKGGMTQFEMPTRCLRESGISLQKNLGMSEYRVSGTI